MIHFIYKITYPDGLIYIGKTTDIEIRFNQHSNPKKNEQKHLKDRVLKFGWENIQKEIIATSNSQSSAAIIEKAFIEHYSSMGICLNIIMVDLNNVISEHASNQPIVKLSLKGEFIEEYKSSALAAKSVNGLQGNISSCVNNYKNSAYGYMWVRKSDYELGYIPKYKRRGQYSESSVIQKDLHGNVINNFHSIRQACKSTGVEKSSIIRYLKGKVKKPHKYTWEYGSI